MSLTNWRSIAVSTAVMLALASGVLAGEPGPASPPGELTTSTPGQPGGAADVLDNPGYNGLPADSLLHNAITQNPRASRTLTSSPLSDALFDASKNPYMNLQLADPNARDVMADIVSCALDRSARVSYRVVVDPSSRATGTWQGELGLCPSWSTDRPSEQCLRVVSSCLFARTNRLHRRVPVRFGFPTLPPRPRVAVTTMLPRNEGVPIKAFARGWQPRYVGSCEPGQPFTLSVPDSALCRKTAIRACENLLGCDIDDATRLGDKRGACDDVPLTFTCPQSGFFSVMSEPGSVDVVHRGPETGRYPAPETQVFPFLEGAFFGNLFEPDGLTRTREVVLKHGKVKLNETPRGPGDDDAIPHPHVYACYSLANDEQGVAYLHGRICAEPDLKKKCFPNPPKRCHFIDPAANQQKGSHCTWNSSDGLFGTCVGDDGVTYPAMTVYLHEQCGLSAAGCASSLPTVPAD